jgi:hypothetical protein
MVATGVAARHRSTATASGAGPDAEAAEIRIDFNELQRPAHTVRPVTLPPCPPRKSRGQQATLRASPRGALKIKTEDRETGAIAPAVDLPQSEIH